MRAERWLDQAEPGSLPAADGWQMNGVPRWFGPPERPLLGWLHEPRTGPTRRGVLLVPPIGLEGQVVVWRYRLLADRLAQSGIVALRFDLDGAGDSAGSGDDPDRVARWSSSIRAALDELRRLRLEQVGVVGSRLGGLLAARESAAEGDIVALVLWDPCLSGRQFLREHSLLVQLAGYGAATGDGSLETVGFRFGSEAVADISALQLGNLEQPVARRVLVLARDPAGAASIRAIRLSDDVCIVETGDHDALLTTRSVPHVTVDSIAAWLGEAMEPDPEPPRTLTLTSGAVPAAELQSPDGAALVERVATLCQGVVGIITEPADGDPRATVVFCASGHRFGPGRMWVDLARRWAARGVRCVRVDLSRLGAEGSRVGERAILHAPPGAADQLVEIVAALSPEGRTPVLLFGLCAGGYLAMEAAARLEVDGVCVVNPLTDFLPSNPAPDERSGAGAFGPGGFKFALRRRAQRWRLLPAVRAQGPSWLWWLLDRFALLPNPARGIEQVVRSGRRTNVICSPTEAERLARRASWVMRRLSQDPRFALSVLPLSDHALVSDASRRAVEERFGEFVASYLDPLIAPLGPKAWIAPVAAGSLGGVEAPHSVNDAAESCVR